MKFIYYIFVISALSSCTNLVQSTRKLGNDIHKATYVNIEKFQELLLYRPEEIVIPAEESAYCYRANQDIVCYKEEQFGLVGELVGSQDGARTSYKAAPKEITYSKLKVKPLEKVSIKKTFIDKKIIKKPAKVKSKAINKKVKKHIDKFKSSTDKNKRIMNTTKEQINSSPLKLF